MKSWEERTMSKKLSQDNLFSQVAGIIESARKNVVYAVNLTMVNAYFQIGKLIVEDEQHGEHRAKYGKLVLKQLSERLSKEFGKGFSVDNLQNMRQFYLTYSKYETLSSISENIVLADPAVLMQASAIKPHQFNLSWSHYLKLMRIENQDERSFYEIECIANNWSIRELQRQFNSGLYERLALSRDKAAIKKLAREGQIIEKPRDILKDPYILEFLGLPEESSHSETELETRIIDQLQKFLLELGKGFTFVGRQVRFTFNEKHYKVDLVFYNRFLRCFVLLDLKIGEVAHKDLGQMMMYVNYYDRKVKMDDENPSIGIILCKEKDESLVEMTLPLENNQIFASKYQTYLPSKAELKALLDSNIDV
jgi:predicted nuclease of restriction endonuclease-like (RecB) superfamily